MLNREWDFKGIVISDWDANHSTVAAAKAGLDIEMPQPVFFGEKLIEAVKNGNVPMAVIDDKVRRILKVKFQAGLFDRQIAPDSSLVNSAENQKLSLTAASEGIVLLKNDRNLLPLNPAKIRSIAVIGPNAALARTGGGGSSHVTPFYSVSPLEGIRRRVGNINVIYAEGDRFPRRQRLPAIPEKYFFTDASKSTPGLKGEYFDNTEFKGRPILVRTDKNLDFDFGDQPAVEGQPKDNFAIRWTGVLVSPVPRDYKLVVNHDDGVRFWLDGKLLLDRWGHPSAGVDTLHVFLDQNKPHSLKIEYDDIQMGASFRLAWDHDVPSVKTDHEPLLREAEEAARKSDVAIVFAGLNEQLEGEGHDVDLHMPANQDELIRRVSRANPNTIVVINGGVPLLVTDWIDKVPCFIDAFLPWPGNGQCPCQRAFRRC